MSSLKHSSTTPKWVKFGEIRKPILVGKEVLCYGDSCFLVFINLITGQEQLYRANNKKMGDGIQCVAGHKSFSVFAFAEKCLSPRIFILMYPDFNSVATIPDGQKFGYQHLAFTESEYIVSLSNLPDFNMIVWNWRTGEKIQSIQTGVLKNDQLIKSIVSNSVVVLAQMAVNTNQIVVWDVLVCGKKCVLTPHEITHAALSPFVSCLWTAEGSLFVLDALGNVYMMNTKYFLDLMIRSEETETGPTSFAWFKAGLLVCGPSNSLKHYKKSGNWSVDWELENPEPMRQLLPTGRELLICVSQKENVWLFNSSENCFGLLKHHESCFDDFCMIYPMGQYIVTLAQNSEVASWEIASGKMIDFMPLDGKALCIKENPEFPYVAVGYSHGLLDLISVFDADKLTKIASFQLTRNPLSSIYFTEIGRFIVTADMDVGQFFIIEGVPGSKMHVVATVEAKQQIADYILVASKTCLRLLAIPVTSAYYIAGNKIIRYCIIKGQPEPAYKEYELEENTSMYSKLYATKYSNRDRVFYAISLTTKNIHELETKRGDNYARIVNTIPTRHQMKKILLHIDKNYSMTYAYDGIVFVYNGIFESERAFFWCHHRMNGGVRRAFVCPSAKHVITLGRSNILLCSSIDAGKVDQEKMDTLKDLHYSARYEIMFKSTTVGFLPRGELAGKTWLEAQEINKREQERIECDKERKDILQEFYEIRRNVQRLLTANIEGPDDEKLNIQEFNMDLEMKQLKIEQNHEDCKRMHAYLLALIAAQDKVSQWIKGLCWEHMSVQQVAIYAMYQNYSVTNYILMDMDYRCTDLIKPLQEYRRTEKLLSDYDMFRPWTLISNTELEELLARSPDLKPEETAANLLDMSDEEEETIDEGNEETQNAYDGCLTHNFVTLEPGHYDQFEVQTFDQTDLQRFLSIIENYKVKLFFNKEMDNMKAIKIREFNNIVEKTARLRHIVSEINYFSVKKLDVTIEDPAWRQNEQPERILIVEPNEIDVMPYVSPSEQAILDAEAAERERLRLLMLADDFRERALMAMMNGVLEVRWEDELRKDVPKPKCLLEKEPEEFNEEDLRAIRDYEAEVVFLNSERERYKVMLEAEYGKLANLVREAIRKFNTRLDEIFMTKLKVDSSINHQSLRMHRKRLRYLQQILSNEEEDFTEKDIADTEYKIEETHKLISQLHEALTDTRGHMEALLGKEKVLEKNFKRDFLEASPMVQDQTQKLYKKRPKVSIRSITSVTLLLELSRAIVTHEKSKVLTNDCVEFLKSVDNLDLYIGISNAVDENMYGLMCKHRRYRIENEIKLKAVNMEIQEGENTILTFQRKLNEYKDAHSELLGKLQKIRTQRINTVQNIEFQMVLKQGIIEMPLTGQISDFHDAILVPRKEVEEINTIILKVGDRKLKAMNEEMSFKRQIIAQEWEHKRMKMKIVDLNEHIKDIESIKVTKELQAYLKAKARGEKEEKITFEQEIEVIKKSYERVIEEQKEKVNELQQKINEIKKENKILDKKIADVNVDVCEMKLEYDEKMEQKEKDFLKLRMTTLLKRANLVKQIQENHNEILVQQTELELLRLKTFPTLKYKIFN